MKPQSLIPLFAAVAAGSTAALAENEAAKSTITITIEKDGKTETRTLQVDADTPFQLLTDAVEKLQDAGTGQAPAQPKKVTYLGVMLENKPGVHGIGFIGGFGGGDAAAGGGAGLFGGGGAVEGSGGPPPAAPGLPPGTGLTVNGVTPDGPAAKAGVQSGDILARLNDQVLVNPDQFTTLVRNMKEGEVVRLAIVRGAEAQELKATLGSREESPTPTRLPLLGDLPQLGRIFTLNADGQVVDASPDAPLPLTPPRAPGTPCASRARQRPGSSHPVQKNRPDPPSIGSARHFQGAARGDRSQGKVVGSAGQVACGVDRQPGTRH